MHEFYKVEDADHNNIFKGKRKDCAFKKLRDFLSKTTKISYEVKLDEQEGEVVSSEETLSDNRKKNEIDIRGMVENNEIHIEMNQK